MMYATICSIFCLNTAFLRQHIRSFRLFFIILHITLGIRSAFLHSSAYKTTTYTLHDEVHWYNHARDWSTHSGTQLHNRQIPEFRSSRLQLDSGFCPVVDYCRSAYSHTCDRKVLKSISNSILDKKDTGLSIAERPVVFILLARNGRGS